MGNGFTGRTATAESTRKEPGLSPSGPSLNLRPLALSNALEACFHLCDTLPSKLDSLAWTPTNHNDNNPQLTTPCSLFNPLPNAIEPVAPPSKRCPPLELFTRTNSELQLHLGDHI